MLFRGSCEIAGEWVIVGKFKGYFWKSVDACASRVLGVVPKHFDMFLIHGGASAAHGATFSYIVILVLCACADAFLSHYCIKNKLYLRKQY